MAWQIIIIFMQQQTGIVDNNEPLPLGRPLNRRQFLHLGGMGLLGASMPLAGLAAARPPVGLPGKLAVQLYTVRNQINQDLPGTLKRVSAIGFDSVETAFWPAGTSVQQAAGYLRDAGLSVSSAHVELPIGDNKQIMLDTAAAYGCKKMIWHGWPEDKRYSSLEGTLELVGIYNEAGKFARAHGLEFGLHNHWWEYRNKVGGRFVYEVLLEQLDKEIFFEVDTYWVKVAGQDPATIVKRLGSRAPLLHIKDGPAKWSDSLPLDNPDPMTAVGKGSQNFPAIVKAAAGNTQWMIVEMDKTAGDVFEALQQSRDYLLNNKLVRA
jgi:sugar phosphate isomerase/epimerase